MFAGMKYSQWIGIAAAIMLVIAGFLPWTYHPDLNKNFTGFFTENNVYGKPGNVFVHAWLFRGYTTYLLLYALLPTRCSRHFESCNRR